MESRPPARQGYFVLHAHTGELDGRPVVRVLIENLGTGEKATFAASDELSRFLDQWGGVATHRDNQTIQTADET